MECEHCRECDHALLHRILTKLKTMEEKLMTQIEDLNAKLAAVQTAIDGVAAEVATAATDAQKAFDDLKAKIAAGAAPTDLSEPLAAADSALQKLAAVSQSLSDVDAAAVAADA